MKMNNGRSQLDMQIKVSRNVFVRNMIGLITNNNGFLWDIVSGKLYIVLPSAE